LLVQNVTAPEQAQAEDSVDTVISITKDARQMHWTSSFSLKHVYVFGVLLFWFSGMYLSIDFKFWGLNLG